MRSRSTLLAVAIAIVALVGSARACGPDPQPVAFWPEPSWFYEPSRADGILVPYEGVRSLLARWRRLQGLAIPPPLATALGPSVWVAGESAPSREFATETGAGLPRWSEARAAFGPAPAIIPTQSVSDEEPWQWFVNCGDDAFAAATKTLEDRAGRHGAGAVEVRRWVEAQDQVFAACGERAPLPPAAEASWPPLARADRAYQVAAARFYNRDYEGAAAAFERIAADKTSPWRELAPYLVARTWIRRSTLDGCPAEECLARAATMLERLAAAPSAASAASVSGPARRLLGYVYARLRPERQRRELAEQITAAQAPRGDEADVARAVDDYVSLRRRAPTDGVEPVTAWIAMLRPPRDDSDEEAARQAVRAAAPRALAAWRAQPTLPWLVAALALGPPASGADGEVLAAAAKVPSSSPAAVTVSFHRARWLVEKGEPGAARPLLDALLARNDLDAGDRNRTLDLRAAAARDVADLAAHAVLVPAPRTHAQRFYYVEGRSAIHDGWLGPAARGLVDETVPLEQWIALVQDAKLPAQVRRSLALTGWVRAVSLDREPTARPLARAAAALDSSLAESLAAWADERTTEGRRFAAAWLLLHHPEPRAGGCATLPIDRPRRARSKPCATTGGVRVARRRGSWPRCRRSRRRHGRPRIARRCVASSRRGPSSPAAPAWMGDAVLSWARAHPEDRRLPEALHLVVRATRYGCPTKGYARVSRAAFELLHRRYPRSEWAERTPYWFD